MKKQHSGHRRQDSGVKEFRIGEGAQATGVGGSQDQAIGSHGTHYDPELT